MDHLSSMKKMKKCMKPDANISKRWSIGIVLISSTTRGSVDLEVLTKVQTSFEKISFACSANLQVKYHYYKIVDDNIVQNSRNLHKSKKNDED